MKLIKINESQHRRLFEGYQESFSFDDLSVLGDGIFNGEDNSVPQMAYCRKHLGEPDSMGSSRAVFTLSDNYVLKLAYGKKYLAGIEQNEAEYKLFQEIDSPLLVKILYHDRNFTYLVSESVLPAEPVDFEKIIGIPYRNTWEQHTEEDEDYYDHKKNRYRTIGFDKYFDDLKDYDEDYRGACVFEILNYIHIKYTNKYDKLYRSNYEELINKIPWFKEIKRLAMTSTIADYISIENFGVVNRDGNPTIVILDSGFNENIWKRYYIQ
jgi:hypothetical protein